MATGMRTFLFSDFALPNGSFDVSPVWPAVVSLVTDIGSAHLHKNQLSENSDF